MGLQLEGTTPTPLVLPGPSRRVESHVAATRTISVNPHVHANANANAKTSASESEHSNGSHSSHAAHSRTRTHAKSGSRPNSSKRGGVGSSHPRSKHRPAISRAKTPPAVLSSSLANSKPDTQSLGGLSRSFPRVSQHLVSADHDGKSNSFANNGHAGARFGEPPAPLSLAFSGANDNAARKNQQPIKPKPIVQTSPLFSRPFSARHASQNGAAMFTPTRNNATALFSSPPHSAPPLGARSVSKHFDFCCTTHSPESRHHSPRVPFAGVGVGVAAGDGIGVGVGVGVPFAGVGIGVGAEGVGSLSTSVGDGVGTGAHTPRAPRGLQAPSESSNIGREPDFAVFHLRHAQLRHTFASIVRQQRAKFTRRLSHNDAFIKQRRLKQAPVHLDVCLLGSQNSGVSTVLNSFLRDGTLFGSTHNKAPASSGGSHSPSLTTLPTSSRRRRPSLKRTNTPHPSPLTTYRSPPHPSHQSAAPASHSSASSPKTSPSLSGSGSRSIELPPTRRSVSDGGAAYFRRPSLSLSFLKRGSRKNIPEKANKGGDFSPISPLSALPSTPPKSSCCVKNVSVSVTFENVPYILDLRTQSSLPSSISSAEEQATLQRTKVFILCFSIDDGSNAFKRVLSTWVPEIREHCSKVVPVLVVGTHTGGLQLQSTPSISPLVPAVDAKPRPKEAERAPSVVVSDAECRRQLLKLNDPNVIFCGHSNLHGSSGANGVNGVFSQASAHGRRYSQEYARVISIKEIEQALREKKESKLSGIKEKLIAHTRKKRRNKYKKDHSHSVEPPSHDEDDPSKRYSITGGDHKHDSGSHTQRRQSLPCPSTTTTATTHSSTTHLSDSDPPSLSSSMRSKKQRRGSTSSTRSASASASGATDGSSTSSTSAGSAGGHRMHAHSRDCLLM